MSGIEITPSMANMAAAMDAATASLNAMSATLTTTTARMTAAENALAARECQCAGVSITALLALNASIDVPIVWPTPFASANYALRISLDNSYAGKGVASLKAGTKTAAGCTITCTASLALVAAGTPVCHITGWM